MVRITWLNKDKIYLLLFASILFLGIFLRFYKLGEIPNSLNWDEVSWGYNSYSILLTGRDEHGSFLPASFKAFGDYKQPVYVYLGTIPIKIFGLSPFSVRFTSAFSGSFSIILVFLLVRQLFVKEKFKSILAILSMLFFAISPWSIQFSRVAYEANLGLFFVLLGVWAYLKGINENKISYFLLSIIPFTISTYTYHSLKIFTPIFVLFLFFFAFRYAKFNTKIILCFITLFFLGNIFWAADLRTTARGRSVTFFSNNTEILKSSAENKKNSIDNKDSLGIVLNDRRFFYLNKYFDNYLSHFDPNYLFIKGDNARHHPPSLGLLYLVSLPLILMGIYFLVFKKNPYSLILLAWFLLAPVASSLAVDAPNSSRSLIFLPTWEIFIAAGVTLIIISAKHKKILLTGIFLLFLINFSYYAHQYFAHMNSDTSPYWQYGYKEAVLYTRELESTGKRIFYMPDIEQGYAFYLFYNKYDPSAYQQEGGSKITEEKCYPIRGSFFGNCESFIKTGDLVVTIKNKVDFYSGNQGVLQSYKSKNHEHAVSVIELK